MLYEALSFKIFIEEVLFILILAWLILDLLCKVLDWFIDWLLKKVVRIYKDITKMIRFIARAALTIGVVFIVFTGAIYFLFPTSFYIDLNSNNHNFELGVPFATISGINIGTDTSYLLKPSFGGFNPFPSGLRIKKLDKIHINLLF